MSGGFFFTWAAWLTMLVLYLLPAIVAVGIVNSRPDPAGRGQLHFIAQTAVVLVLLATTAAAAPLLDGFSSRERIQSTESTTTYPLAHGSIVGYKVKGAYLHDEIEVPFEGEGKLADTQEGWVQVTETCTLYRFTNPVLVTITRDERDCIPTGYLLSPIPATAS